MTGLGATKRADFRRIDALAAAAVPGEGGATKEAQARAATLRLLHVLAAAALMLPLSLFLFASWLSYRDAQQLAHERIARSLDVMEEQALKAFQSMNLALDTIDNLLGNRSPAEIEADRPALRQRLIEIQKALPEVQSIWVFGPDGHPQVITRDDAAPFALNYGDEDYFRVPREGPPGVVYIGGVHPSTSGGESYFTYDRGRHDADGKFTGVIEMSLLPGDFTKFYSALVSGAGVRFALVRDDGTILARYPAFADLRLDARSAFRRAVASTPAGGFYTTTSAVDDIERLVGIRRLPGLPVYVTAGIETRQVLQDWANGMALHLIFGIPATALLFGATLVVLQRTKRLYAEQDRRAAAEAVLRQKQRLDSIGELTGGVAHDFNNLLTVIIGNLETAQRQLESWTEGAQIKLAQRIANAMHGARRAATLTKRLLAFSRQQPLNPIALDVNRLLTSLSEFLKRALGEQISLEIVGSGGLWSVEADAAELEAAVLNLAVNARDAMPDGGKLTIETSNSFLDEAYCAQNPDVRPGQYVQIAVTDTGQGMAKETIDRAFDPFFTTKPSGQGTGLGLSQVHGFVKQSGGHVKIYSEVGNGTTVKVYLPRFLGGHGQAEAARDEPSRGRAGECILVVEDDPDVRGYVVETLAGLGYDVLAAAVAGEALKLLGERKTVKLLLTDVVMPGVNGRGLADEARRRQPALKVVFMTGYSRNAIVHQGRLDPGVEFIQKPVTSAHLAATIRRVLDA